MEKSIESSRSIPYTQFSCIGAGFSGICLGATLQRWHGITDVQIFERHPDLGGTWYINQYPGAACDINSILYSFSFVNKPDWSSALPSRDELHEYLGDVADRYNLRPKMKFNSTVQKCEWIEETNRWRLTVRDDLTDTVFLHECQFLFGATGVLSNPRPIGIPGHETFAGELCHSGAWRREVELENKNVVLIGNGCSATQIVPAILDKVNHLTQFSRSPHWLISIPKLPHNKLMTLAYRYLPGFHSTVRYGIYLLLERDFSLFQLTSGGNASRARRSKKIRAYMTKLCPEKYVDFVIPNFELGCRRRINNINYLESLHSDRVTLTNDPIVEIVPEGVRTKNGVVNADVIICATGFVANTFMGGIEVVGRDGETATEHWEARGGNEGYNSVCMSGFPNFFMVLGPNSTTGYTSTIIAIENGINFALRLIKPILDGKSVTVEVKDDAETRDVAEIRTGLENTVFSTGCNAWYSKEGVGKKPQNTVTYPFSQFWFWARCFWPRYRDFVYKPSKQRRRTSVSPLLMAALFLVAGSAGLAWSENGADYRKYLPFLIKRISRLRSTVRL